MTAAGARVALLVAGSTGDIVPAVALALGLRAAGFVPRIVTHARFRPLAEAHALDFVPVADDPLARLQHGAARHLLRAGANPLALGMAMRGTLNESIEGFLAASLEGAGATDLILASDLAVYVAASVGEKLGIPVVPALLHPTGANAAHRNPFVDAVGGSPAVNRLSHMLFWHGSWLLFRPLVNRARARVLGLPPLPVRPLFPGHRDARLTLCGYSPAVVPDACRSGEGVHATGYWFMPRTPETSVPPDLKAFVEAGMPPVCIGFGSMADRQAGELAAASLAAARRGHHRVVLLGGWAGLATEDLRSADVFVADHAPHDWLFPRMAAVVHHAGAGTVAAALRAGCPSVPVPYFGDQFFWARRIHELGAATPALPRKRLTITRLARAIDWAVAKPGIRLAAHQLRARITAENGTAEAAKLLQNAELRPG